MTSPDTVDLTDPSASPSAPPTAARSSGLILAFLCVAQFMVFLDVSIVNVALPSIQRSLGFAESDLQYIVTAYGTVLGGFLLLGGRLADTLGRRRLLQTGLVVFAGTSLIAGLAQDDTVLIVARGFQGLGSALIAPAALSTLTTVFREGAERNKALGIWGSLAGIASVCGVLFGGLLTEGPGWRWIFFINVPIGLVAAVLAPSVLPESRDESRRGNFDFLGAGLLTGGLLLLIYTINEAVNVGWDTNRTIGSLVAAGVLLVTFVLVELRARSPLMPLGIFRRSTLRTANIATLFLFGSTVTLFFFASLYMQQVLDYSALETGLAYLPLAIVVSVGAGVASGLVTKVAAKPVLATGLLLSATGLLMLSQVPTDADYLQHLLPAFLVVGAGLGLSFVPLQIAAFVGVEERESGLAAGLINTSQETGGALGVAIVSTIAFTRIDDLMAKAGGDPAALIPAQASGFHQAFFVGACFAAASLALAVALLPWMGAEQRAESPAVAA
ncbi:MAG TPA: MFS transporter [Acidimicrobiales bacterium]|nr:MFS transporter [Acidimicrobiales bacterium]